MKISKETLDQMLATWRSLNEHVVQLNKEEVEQLLAHELRQKKPRMQFVLRIHSRLTKLEKQAMDVKRLLLIQRVKAKHGDQAADLHRP